MLITNEGVIIRIDTADINTLKRVTKGVRLMRLGEGVKIVSAAAVAHEEEGEPEGEEAVENTANTDTDAGENSTEAVDNSVANV